MSITVAIDLGCEFEVKAATKDVFAVLADVPVSASFFPKVENLVDLGKGTYRWEMEKIGVASISLQTIYASTYVSNKAKGTIDWTRVPGVGNAQVSGSWRLKNNKKSTHITLQINGEIAIPLPVLMKSVVAPVVEAEFEAAVETYIANLIEKFGGEI